MIWLVAWFYFAGVAASTFVVADHLETAIVWRTTVFLAAWPITVPLALIFALVSK